MAGSHRIIHYLNQFFGQIGGEDAASHPPVYKSGPLGPGRFLDVEMTAGDIIGTIVCGDNYATENADKLTEFVLEVIETEKPDILIAGPAFNSGRYGMACASVCKVAQNTAGIACVTGLHEENPALALYQSDIPILKTKATAAGMKAAIQHIARFVAHLTSNDQSENTVAGLLFKQGKLQNVMDEKVAAVRAVEMVKALLETGVSATEIPLPDHAGMKKAVLGKPIHEAEIALITDGGLVPAGNPDRLESRCATKFLLYPIENTDSLQQHRWSVAHEGYDNQYVLQNPHRLVPLDAMRRLERDGRIKKIHKNLITTTGVATSLAVCRKIGKEMAQYLVKQQVDAAILTST